MARNTARRLVLVLVCSIFISEILLMLGLTLLPPMPLWQEVLIDATGLALVSGTFTYLFGFKPLTRNLRELKEAQQQLSITAAAFETHEGIMITDADANIIRVNKAFEQITGHAEHEVLGKNPRMLKSGCYDKSFYVDFWQQLLTKGSWDGELLDRRKNGEVYPQHITITAVKNAEGETTQYVAIFNDVSERKKAEDKIYHLAFYDMLTQLPNRQLLLDRLNAALHASERNRQYCALLFLEVGNLKLLNESLGHEYGDMMLVQAANRLKTRLRKVDTVARYGGNEYMLLLLNIGSNEEEASYHVNKVTEKICSALSEPFRLKKIKHHCKPSIGVTLFYGHNETADELIKRVDIAMHQAKKLEHTRVKFFDAQMQKLVETRAAVEADLRRALAARELFLVYQLQVDRHLKPLGAEALMRWRHPQRGIVPPMEFIPIAEETSLILDLGSWLLDAACWQLANWSRDERTQDLVLAVNISARQFKQPDFVEQVAAAIRKHHIAASKLKLELTESIALEDIDDVIEKMRLLKRDVGVTISLDDFGTGFSSLSYLNRLPLDEIKIDRGFMRNIAIEVSDAVMVKTIIDMSINFELDVIAEGVETEEQLNFLMQNGCLAFQGYYFSKPVPVEDFEALLTQANQA